MISLHEIASAFSKPSEHRFASLFQSNPVQNKLLGFFLFRLLFCFRLYLFDTLWIILFVQRLETKSLAHVRFCNASHYCHLSSRRFSSKLEIAVLTSASAARCKICFLNFQGCITVYLSRFLVVITTERRRRDLNPRAAWATYTLSRGASSASWVFLLTAELYPLPI